MYVQRISIRLLSAKTVPPKLLCKRGFHEATQRGVVILTVAAIDADLFRQPSTSRYATIRCRISEFVLEEIGTWYTSYRGRGAAQA